MRLGMAALAFHTATRMVRRGRTPLDFRIRMASITVVAPSALSAAPTPECQQADQGKWACGQKTAFPETTPGRSALKYMRNMFDGRAKLDNDCYPGIRWTTARDVLSEAGTPKGTTRRRIDHQADVAGVISTPAPAANADRHTEAETAPHDGAPLGTGDNPGSAGTTGPLAPGAGATAPPVDSPARFER
jgi:hypothetical protein